MSIENELLAFLSSQIKDGSNKARDIEIVNHYYGFNDSVWPTLDETAKKFNIGTRERVRQLLNAKFRSHVAPESMKALREVLNILESKAFWALSEFKSVISTHGLVGATFSVKGIFNLAEDVGLENEFDIYTPQLKKATRTSIESSQETFIIKKTNLARIESALKSAKDLPGRCGIANLRYISEFLGSEYEHVKEIIASTPTAWIKNDGNHFWYLFENKDNTIINYSEKIFSAVNSCESKRLASSYRNALDGRTHKHPYPPEEIIQEYLESSIYFKNNSGLLKFEGETTELNQIDEDIFSYFSGHALAKFPELRSYLNLKGYGAAHILKAISSSPLVFVDKSNGRQHYTYSLIAPRKTDTINSPSLERYDTYLSRLRKLLDTGTDNTVEQNARKEQTILQAWLFEDKEQEQCALCNCNYSVRTLVAAHKKNRAECNDAERLDPYIVMPLCLMGCDYLYEHMYVYIDNGVIRKGVDLAGADYEAATIQNLVGKKVDPRWLMGLSKYFRTPTYPKKGI
ncbi:hypothetical protein [Pseudomonas sp. HLS-6 TE3448]